MVDMFCRAYIDNILIFSNLKKNHQKHIQKVLGAFQKAGFQADIDKCAFYMIKITYIGLIITIKNIQIDFQKFEAL